MILYFINWIISLRTKSIPVKIRHAELLPSSTTFIYINNDCQFSFFTEVLHISFKLPNCFRFHSGQWVRIACDKLGAKEFHPFTITSAPHERCVSLYVRAVGPWTNRLVEAFSQRTHDKIPFPRVKFCYTIFFIFFELYVDVIS